LVQPPLPHPDLPPVLKEPPPGGPGPHDPPLVQPPLPQPHLPPPHLSVIEQPHHAELSPHPQPPQVAPQQAFSLSANLVEGHVVPPNHEPDFVVAPGDVTEDRNVSPQGFLVTQGRVTVFDPDPGQDHVRPAELQGAYGTLLLRPDGSWTYSVRNDLPGIQQLNQGDTLRESFIVQSADGTPQKLVVTIHGTDDHAVMESTPLTLQEDVNVTPGGLLVAEGFVAVEATDPSQAHVVPGTIAGTYGTFVVNADGTWRYAAANNQPVIQALGSGDSLKDTAQVHSADGTAHSLHVTIQGSDDRAWITSTPGNVTEDRNVSPAGLLLATGQLHVADDDAGQDHMVPQTLAGNYGTFTVGADGHWRYAATNAQPEIQGLGAGESMTDAVRVHSADGTSHLLQVTIHGANDAPRFQSSPGQVTEDRGVGPGGLLTTSGVVIVSDPDQDQNHLVPQTHEARFGTFEVNADGSWRYTADNSRPDIQDLRDGETLVDRLRVESTDGTSHQIQVVIHGANETWGIRPLTGSVSSGGWGGGSHDHHGSYGGLDNAGNHYGWSSDLPQDADAPAAPYAALVPDAAAAPAVEGEGNPYLDHVAMDPADGDHLAPQTEPDLPSSDLTATTAGVEQTGQDGVTDDPASTVSTDAIPVATGMFDLEPPLQHQPET
jgi:VCBS repeat-containing protein